MASGSRSRHFSSIAFVAPDGQPLEIVTDGPGFSDGAQ